MVKHIVMWKLKAEAEGRTKEENAVELKRRLEDLKGKISEIKHLEVGFQMEPSEAAYDVVLYSHFDSKSDLGKYQNHPEHQKVVEFVKKVIADRKIVDYEN